MKQTSKTAGARRVLTAVAMATLWLAGAAGGFAAEASVAPGAMEAKAGGGAAWPLWDGKESVADYAKRAGIKDVQMELDLGDGVSLKLTLIPAGKYLRGLREEDVEIIEGTRVLVREADKGWNYGNGPQREVTISKPFYMGVYEVTQEQFQQVMGFNPSAVDDNVWPAPDFKPEMFVGKNRPVNNIRNQNPGPGGNRKEGWADTFCEKVSAKTGMKVTLPTAAQWEFAYKAGTKTAFYWGDNPAEACKYENLGDKCFTKAGLCKYQAQFTSRNENQDDGFDQTAPVGSFKPNPWGLYDMIGNVMEWVSDWSTTTFFGAPTVDPAGPAYTVGNIWPNGAAGWRVWRGVAFGHGPGLVFGNGGHGPPIYTFFGFRVVASLNPTGAPAQAAKDGNPPKASAVTGTALAKDKQAPKAAGPVDPKLRVPAGCRAVPGTQVEPYTKTGWAQAIVHEATGVEMVYVPAGSFQMGVNKEDKVAMYFPDVGGWEIGQHRVTLTKGFYMGKTEVTQAQWEKVMGQNPAHFTNAGPEAPVEMVSWESSQTFCQKAGGGLRLPTEAEWEYACRAGTTDLYPPDLNDTAWYIENSDGTTQAVGTKKPNAWGLYDMHGNVWEWCQDVFENYRQDDATDPTGPTAKGGQRVIRGGGWGDYGGYCAPVRRAGIMTTGEGGKSVDAKTSHIGCRLAITAAGAP